MHHKKKKKKRSRESELFVDGDSGHVFLIFILYHVHPLKKKSLTDSHNSEFLAIHIFFLVPRLYFQWNYSTAIETFVKAQKFLGINMQYV